jgi:hypothetical protein
MKADDLLCSRNARPRTTLVGRAQWKIYQPPSLREKEQAWREQVYHPMCAVKGSLGHSRQERHMKSGSLRWMRTRNADQRFRKALPRPCPSLLRPTPAKVFLKSELWLE